jgi:hypothetical protein
MHNRVGREALILAGFLAFGVWATWPLASNLFSSFPANNDLYAHTWMLWWVQDSLFSLSNPFSTDYVLAPTGSYLAYGPLMPLVGVVLAPVTALFGAGVSRNLTSLLVPVLGAYITYRLALRFGLVRWVAVLTGGLYGFSTILSIRAAAHINLACGALFIPLALLCAVRYRQSGSLRDAILFGASLGAAALVDPSMAIFSAALSMAYLVAVHAGDRTAPRQWAVPLAVAVITALLVASPQLVTTVRQETVDEPTDVVALAGTYKTNNASVLAEVSPSPNLRLGTPLNLDEIMSKGHAGELVPAFGWGLLGLAAVGIVLARRRRLAIGLFAAALGAGILALGPEFTLDTFPRTPLAIEFAGQELSGLMPFSWLVQIPGMEQLRVAARFVLLGLVPVALLAGLGLEALVRRGNVAKVAAAFLVALAVLEAGWTRPIAAEEVPLTRDSLYEPVEADTSESIVVDIPLTFSSGLGGYYGGDIATLEGMYRAAEHGHPIATALLARLPKNRADAQLAHRFYTDIIAHQSGATPRSVEEGEHEALGGRLPPELVQPEDPKEGARNARSMGVGWVVIWPEVGVSERTRKYIEDVGFTLEREVDGIELYRAPPDWAVTEGG